MILDKSGKFLYACNRGFAEELLTYSIGPEGRLTLIGKTPLSGKEARHFAISPNGTYLVVTERSTNRAHVFSCDLKNGKLTETGTSYPVNLASCIVFVWDHQ